MPELMFIGDVDSPRRVTATVVYDGDYRDADGTLPRPVYRFSKLPDQGWTDFDFGGPAKVLGPTIPGQSEPKVTVTYTTVDAFGRPWARSVDRRIIPNTELPGYWDFTLPDSDQPNWEARYGLPTPVNVLPGQGEKGDPGSQILTGAEDPTPDNGKNGDLYINYTTSGVFHRIADEWIYRFNMQGARGADGGSGVVLPGGGGGRVPTPKESDDGKTLRVLADENGNVRYVLVDGGGSLYALDDVDLGGYIEDGMTLTFSDGKWRGIVPGGGGGNSGIFLNAEGYLEVQ